MKPQVNSSHGSIHGKHGGGTHGSPPPVKGGGVSRCTHHGTTMVLTELGFDVRIDEETLDPIGELRATVAGLTTYTRHVGTGAVFHRGPGQIRERPAGTRPRQEVHAEHRCPPTTQGDA